MSCQLDQLEPAEVQLIARQQEGLQPVAAEADAMLTTAVRGAVTWRAMRWVPAVGSGYSAVGSGSEVDSSGTAAAAV